MLLLGAVALATLLMNATGRMRLAALAFLAVSLIANAIAASTTTVAQVAVLAAAGIAASGILVVAAGDGSYGEDPGPLVWAATGIATAATPVAFVAFRAISSDAPELSLVDIGEGSVIVQVAAFWLLASGTAILVTARRAVRTSLGALLMLTGVQLLMRTAPGPQLELTIAVAWVELVVALTGAYLVVNERAVRE